MLIRRATASDIPRINALLYQVLSIHAALRPDLFVPGTKKYSDEELECILADEKTPVFAAVDEGGLLLGYCFCVLEEAAAANLRPIRTLYIDDLCVDASARGRQIGRALCERVLAFARERNCYHVTLNVWEGNAAARAFYDALGFRPEKTTMELVDRKSVV